MQHDSHASARPEFQKILHLAEGELISSVLGWSHSETDRPRSLNVPASRACLRVAYGSWAVKVWRKPPPCTCVEIMKGPEWPGVRSREPSVSFAWRRPRPLPTNQGVLVGRGSGPVHSHLVRRMIPRHKTALFRGRPGAHAGTSPGIPFLLARGKAGTGAPETTRPDCPRPRRFLPARPSLCHRASSSTAPSSTSEPPAPHIDRHQGCFHCRRSVIPTYK